MIDEEMVTDSSLLGNGRFSGYLTAETRGRAEGRRRAYGIGEAAAPYM